LLHGAPDARVLGWVTGVATAGIIALVLRLAFVNHRSSDRGARRPVAQAAIVAGAMTCAAALVFVSGVLSR
jgi:hypothetical protein